MPKVLIIPSYDFPDLRRQLPKGTKEWGGIKFTFDTTEPVDYALIINDVIRRTTITVHPDHIWNIIQEPPTIPQYRKLNRGHSAATKVITTDEATSGPRYLHSHTALPWHVNKTFDELIVASYPTKIRDLSWITSNKANTPGTRQRMSLLENLRKSGIPFDLFGRGFQPINDKWDGLYPYRYSLAIENHVNNYYWTEKIADCLLAWTIPIYHGCARIDQYFPKGSHVKIDITDPNAAKKIRDIVNSDLAERNRDAIQEARDLILHKYNIFNLVTELVIEDKGNGRRNQCIQNVVLSPCRRSSGQLFRLAYQKLRRLLR
jgi:hypothetical protein